MGEIPRSRLAESNRSTAKLRSGVPFWRCLATQSLPTQPLSGDATCEVLVIGGGVTGALIALLLVSEGVDTLLIDRGEPAEGSSAASTGLLQYEIDTHLVDLIDRVGQQKAVHAYRRGLGAIDEIESLCRSWADHCGFSRRMSLYFASHRWHSRRLRREWECRREHGFAVDYWDRNQLAQRSSIRAAAALWSQGDAQLDTYRFTLQVLRQAISRGLRIASQTEAVQIDLKEDGGRVQTPRGQIAARKIVLATGYAAHKYLPEQNASVSSTYALASEPMASLEGWPDGCLIWETTRPYFYARRTDDERALIGGADTAFSSDHRRDSLVVRQSARLVKRFQQLFPASTFEPAYAWAGTFGETKDGLAFIGEHPKHPAAYFALGYGGNGITFSMIAARLIADLYLRRPNADEQVFGFDR